MGQSRRYKLCLTAESETAAFGAYTLPTSNTMLPSLILPIQGTGESGKDLYDVTKLIWMYPVTLWWSLTPSQGSKKDTS